MDVIVGGLYTNTVLYCTPFHFRALMYMVSPHFETKFIGIHFERSVGPFTVIFSQHCINEIYLSNEMHFQMMCSAQNSGENIESMRIDGKKIWDHALAQILSRYSSTFYTKSEKQSCGCTVIYLATIHLCERQISHSIVHCWLTICSLEICFK